MRKRPFRKEALGRGLATVVLAFAFPTQGCEQSVHLDGTVPPARIVVVTIDTLRADHVGCYGADFARTPVLDDLARQGIRFEHAIAPQPLTLPSHATLLTGLDPPFHGVRENVGFRLRDDVATLAERLREGGYATAAVVSVAILGEELGFGRGFEHFDAEVEHGTRAGRAERSAERSVDAALAWLAEAPDRFFLWVHLYDPHTPYAAPGRLRRWLSASPYDAEIAYADSQLGRLVEAVRQRWPDGRTLFVATSDHGEGLGQHVERTHSYTVYDATQRVPLLLAGSGLPRGRVVSSVVRLADVAPTLVALAGLEPLPGTSGRDLRPTWEGVADPPRTAYVETLATQLHWGWSPLLGLRSDDYKYIRAPRPELYDLRSDPGEQRNLALERPGVVAELDARLSERLAGAPPPESVQGISSEMQEALEALGYVASAPARGASPLGQVGGPDPKDHMELLLQWRRAEQLLASRRDEEAWKLLESMPSDAPFLEATRIGAALRTGRIALAEHHARRALEGGLHTSLVLVGLGEALARQDRIEEAEEVFRRALELDPSRVDALVGLGLAAERRRRDAEAEALYRRALERRPTARAHYMLAALLLEKGRDDEAQGLLERLDPSVLHTPEAAWRLALAEANSGRRQQGLERVERALRESPDSQVLLEARRTLGGG